MRLLASVVLLALVLGGAGALAAWGAQRAPGESATYRVEVLGPEGALADVEVDVPEATALSALLAAAEREGLPVELSQYPGMGAYVRSIGGHEARGASGWVYEVLREGVWTSGDRSAERFPLQKGDALRWSWTAS